MGYWSTQTLLQRRHMNGQSVQEKCWASLAIRELKTKTTQASILLWKEQLSPILRNPQMLEGCMGKLSFCVVVGNVNQYNRYWNQYGESSKTKHRSSMWPSYNSCVFLPERVKGVILQKYMRGHISKSTLHSSLIMEAAYLLISRWMKEENVVFIHKGVPLSQKKDTLSHL